MAVTLLAAGCDSGKVNVYPVRGKVLFEGKPMVGGGAISFIPTGPQAGKAAGGEIAEDGTYQLSTYMPGDGSMAGEFRVLITQTVFKEPEATEDGTKPREAEAAVPPAQRIPTIYSDPNRSPLTAKVEEKEVNEIDFHLERSAGQQQHQGAMRDVELQGKYASRRP